MCLSDVISLCKYECMDSVGHNVIFSVNSVIYFLSCSVLKEKSMNNIYLHTLSFLFLTFLDSMILFSLSSSIATNLDHVTVTENLSYKM